MGRIYKTPKLAIAFFLVLEVLTLAVDGAEAFKNPLREVQATEILAKIQNSEPVEYDHVIIKDNLDLSTLDLPTKHVNRTHSEAEARQLRWISGLSLRDTQKIITSLVRINDSVFEGFVDFSNINFKNKIDLSGSNFTKRIDFTEATFSKDADFNGATFNDNAEFNGATFSERAYFGKVLVLRLISSLIYSYGTNGATFKKGSNFERAIFNKPAFFGDVTFEHAYFKDVTFSDDALFRGATFSPAVFRNSTFCRDVYFEKAKFNEGTYFDGAKFGGLARIGSATFKGYFLGWLEVRNALDCDEATYLGLIENFKDHGQFDEADDCYFQYRYQYMSGPVDWLGFILCGFGVRLSYVILCSMAFILFFAFLYWKNKSIYKIDNSKRAFKSKVDGNLSFNDALFFSALVFFTLHPPHGWEYSGNWKYSVLLEDVLGGALIALFIVVLSNIIIR